VAEHEQWDIVSSVGATALGVAVARALETRDPNGLIEDPYAERLSRAAQPEGQITDVLDEEPGESTAALWAALATHLGLRSRFFDDYFAEAAEKGAKQAVILAAGLDARAYRLDWPDGFTVFEIDQPKVLEFKDRVLAEDDAEPRCKRFAVRADLREDWVSELRKAGFDPELPTAWLAEGLLPYLPPEAEEELLASITRLSAPGSHVALEQASPGGFTQLLEDEPMFNQVSEGWGLDMRQLVHFDERPPAVERLGQQGWTVDRDATGATIAEEYGREFSGDTAKFLDFVRYAKLHRD
jgi:methyltransferase (TIGR00027 family)